MTITFPCGTCGADLTADVVGEIDEGEFVAQPILTDQAIEHIGGHP